MNLFATEIIEGNPDMFFSNPFYWTLKGHDLLELKQPIAAENRKVADVDEVVLT